MDAITFLETSRRMALTQLPVRSAVVQLQGARLLLSPASTLSSQQLHGAGSVTDIVCPSLFHTAGVKTAVRAHPGARLWGPPGIRRKCPDLGWSGILGEDPWPFERELALLPLAGMPTVNECLFLHRPSRTLFVTDLVFHLLDAKGPGAFLLLSATGAWRRLAVSRLFLALVKDRAAFRASIDRLLTLDFERLVPAHGTVVESRGRERLAAALQERGYGPAGATPLAAG